MLLLCEMLGFPGPVAATEVALVCRLWLLFNTSVDALEDREWAAAAALAFLISPTEEDLDKLVVLVSDDADDEDCLLAEAVVAAAAEEECADSGDFARNLLLFNLSASVSMETISILSLFSGLSSRSISLSLGAEPVYVAENL